jgi:hypothetical protein
MKNKITVGLFGKLHGLHSKLLNDLPALGYTPIELNLGDLAHPPETIAVICALPELHPEENRRGYKDLNSLSLLLESLRDDQVHLIFVSIAASNQPESLVTNFGHLDLQAEAQIRKSDIPYTIVRAMSAEDRPGHHHKLYWKQDTQGLQKGAEHPVPWEDLAQVLVNCVNRPLALSKTFTVHAVAGTPSENWDQWFQGLTPDSIKESTVRKTG